MPKADEAPEKAGQLSPESRQRGIGAALETLEVRPHLLAAPGIVARRLRDLIPISLVWHNGDHRVVRGAATERAGARIEHTLALPCSLIGSILRVCRSPHGIIVVMDEEFPRHRGIFGCKAVKAGHRVGEAA